MYITVSLKIELAATASLTEMEGQIQTAGRAAMQAALQTAIRQSEDAEMSCPACGSEQQHSYGTKRRVLLTSFGRVEVSLKRRRCQQCQQRYRPADTCLAEVRGHKITLT
jgi:hypothetical protein